MNSPEWKKQAKILNNKQAKYVFRGEHGFKEPKNQEIFYCTLHFSYRIKTSIRGTEYEHLKGVSFSEVMSTWQSWDWVTLISSKVPILFEEISSVVCIMLALVQVFLILNQ